MCIDLLIYNNVQYSIDLINKKRQYCRRKAVGEDWEKCRENQLCVGGDGWMGSVDSGGKWRWMETMEYFGCLGDKIVICIWGIDCF